MPGRVNLNQHINSTLSIWPQFYSYTTPEQVKCTYSTGVRDDIGNICRRVDRRRIIGALLRKIHEARYFQREALAVDHMPMELVNLGGERSVNSGKADMDALACERTLTQLIASRVRLMSATGKLVLMRNALSQQNGRIFAHKFRAVSSMKPR